VRDQPGADRFDVLDALVGDHATVEVTCDLLSAPAREGTAGGASDEVVRPNKGLAEGDPDHG
jgi:hypothetical protein